MFHLNIIIYVDVTFMLFTFYYNKHKIYNVRMVCCAETMYRLETNFKTPLPYE
jgi:hypothetical protein